MKSKFPSLPNYRFYWRSLLVEPIPHSGERFSIGVIVQGEDRSLIASKLLPFNAIKVFFGVGLGGQINDAVNLVLKYTEAFYRGNHLYDEFTPPLEGFDLSEPKASASADLESALLSVSVRCSAHYFGVNASQVGPDITKSISEPELWRREILKAVKRCNSQLASMFNKKIVLNERRAGELAFNLGFLSDKYAAHFDAVGNIHTLQQTLIRTQSKLWQLDILKDSALLFKPEDCELIFKVPTLDSDKDSRIMNEFVEEITFEASRKNIGVFAAKSQFEAANRIIDKVA